MSLASAQRDLAKLATLAGQANRLAQFQRSMERLTLPKLAWAQRDVAKLGSSALEAPRLQALLEDLRQPLPEPNVAPLAEWRQESDARAERTARAVEGLLEVFARSAAESAAHARRAYRIAICATVATFLSLIVAIVALLA